MIKIGSQVYTEVEISKIDTSRIEELIIVVSFWTGENDVTLKGQEALDVIMQLKPSAIEGKHLRFARQAWAFHNLVAHPLLQVLAWLGMHKLGFRIHDATIPRPIETK